MKIDLECLTYVIGSNGNGQIKREKNSAVD